MLTVDETLDAAALIGVLSGEWDLDLDELVFIPVGADSHNYRAVGAGGAWFVSVKRGGAGPVGEVEASYRAVQRLVEEAGIEFLSTALPRRDGRLAGSFAGRPVVVQRWLDGETRDPHRQSDVAPILTMIRRLHGAAADLGDAGLPHDVFDAPFLSILDEVLERFETAVTGPHSDWLRHTLRRSLDEISLTRERFLEGRESVRARGESGWAITHGEPFGANVIWVAGDPVLVDCGEMLFAPPERDLSALQIQGDPEATALYRRRWVLSEIAEYADRLSRPHADDAEDRRARAELDHWLRWTG